MKNLTDQPDGGQTAKHEGNKKNLDADFTSPALHGQNGKDQPCKEREVGSQFDPCLSG